MAHVRGRVFRHVVRDAACGLLLIDSTSAQDCGSDCVAQRLRTWRRKMKAIRVHEFGGPEVLKLEDAPTPKPSAGQVLVRIHAAGVNPYDTYMRAGTYAV